MKKILAICALLMLIGLNRASAQVNVSVNIGGPPAWGPYGYNEARFYFIPDIDVYYDVWYGNYWYLDYGVWTCQPSLPPRYAGFNLYGCYKVVLDYRGANPYRYYNDHRVSYARYRNWNGPRQYTYYDRGYTRGYSKGYNRGVERGRNYSNGGGRGGRIEARPAQRNSVPEYRGGGNKGRIQAAPQNNQRSQPQYRGGNRGNGNGNGNAGGNRGGGGQGGGNRGGQGGGRGNHR